MKQHVDHDLPPLSEEELALLEAEKKQKRTKSHTVETYGMHTHVAQPTSHYVSEPLHHSLVRRHHRPRNYKRTIAFAMALSGVCVGALTSFAITHNPIHLLIGIGACIAVLPLLIKR